jgi:hypothetical protein
MEVVAALLMYYPDNCKKVLGKTTKNLSQNSRCPGLNSNRALSEHEFRVLPLSQAIRLVCVDNFCNNTVSFHEV